MRGPRIERTIENSRTRAGGDYSNNIRKGIQDTSLGNRTTN